MRLNEHRVVLAVFFVASCSSEPFADPPGPPEFVDLSRALIVGGTVQGERGAVVQKSVTMLQEEIEKRSGVKLRSSDSNSAADLPAIVLGTRGEFPDWRVALPPGLELPRKADSYAIWVDLRSRKTPTVYLLGHDPRGALFAAGRLLRLLELGPGRVALASDVVLGRAPRYAIRGHQLGYRHTANSYDAWDLETYEQYFRDLILFGTNAVEIIEEGGVGPHLQVPMSEMNAQLTKILKSYGLDVWIWEPLGADVSDPTVARAELDKRREFYSRCARIDHIMVPGGDPGHTHPTVLLPWLGRHAEVLHEFFPDAGLWVSHQKFTPEESEVFFRYLRQEQPSWLTGVVYGPSPGMTLPEMRQRTPVRYQLRRYPDITHNVRCQYPIPGLDTIIAQTLGREGINPRPRGTAHIHDVFARFTDGFVSYSDGIHDDLNKMVWSELAWTDGTGADPDADAAVEAVLVDYGRVFFGAPLARDVARGLRMLEGNLEGSVLAGEDIDKTLAHWLEIERRGGAALASNWRLQMYIFRACFDAFIRARHVAEMGYENAARAALARAAELGVSEAVAAALAALRQADSSRIRTDLRERIQRLGAQLMESIGFQLSVKAPYLARNPERGALLDKIDRPLNDRPWLEMQLQRILGQTDRDRSLALIGQILNWEDAGPGGFYDDLGNARRQPHLVRQTTWSEDPGFVRGPQEAHYRSMNNSDRKIEPLKLSWLDYAQTSGATPLLMRYEDLEPGSRYRLRVTYFGRYSPVMRLTADRVHEIHGPLPMPRPVAPVEFVIPPAATADGKLELRWDLVDRRGCQVAEVWLMKMDQ